VRVLPFILRFVLPLLVVAFVGMQFVRPARTNPPYDPANELRAPQPVQAILERSCYDCHSSRTRWRWYSHVAPLSWTLVHDVDEGRAEMSFTNWKQYPPRDADHLLEEICEVVEKGEMPLRGYVFMHPRAQLLAADKAALCAWAAEERAKLAASR